MRRRKAEDLRLEYLSACYPNYKWISEFRFFDKRKWRADYACKELKLIIEVEGLMGRHQFTGGFIKDMQKYNYATMLGYKVLRTTTGNFYSEEFQNIIKTIIEEYERAMDKHTTS